MNASHTLGQRTSRTAVQIAALMVGILFLLVGIAGFLPVLTTNYDSLAFGHESRALLFGVFQVSVLHNIVHLLFGVAGVVAWRSATASRGFLLIGGVIYLLLAVYGMLIDQASAANFVPVNNADNWLHVGLGVVMIGLSFLPRHASIAETEYLDKDRPVTRI